MAVSAKRSASGHQKVSKPKGKPRGRAFPKGKSPNPGGKPKPKPVEPVAPPSAGQREVAPPVVHEEPPDNTLQLLALIDEVLSREGLDAGARRNLVKRRSIVEGCRGRADWQEVVRRWCGRSIRLFIDLFVWQYNPTKTGGEVGPFILWDVQSDILLSRRERGDEFDGMLACYEQGTSCVIEKSREMGLSWINLIFQDWLCRFQEWVKCLNISRDADAVDASGDPDSLFWKLDFIHEHLPSWMQGRRTKGQDRKRFHIYYPRTRSTITGEASTGKAGVGGRASVIFVDEFPLIKEDKQVRQRTASTSRVRFFNGTHNGTQTEFYKLTKTPEVAKIQAHWTRHPDKNKGLYSYDTEQRKLRFWEYVAGSGLRELRGPTHEYPSGFDFVLDGTPTGGPHPGLRSPWYDRKSRDIGTQRAVAEELDIDPSGSASRPFDPLLVHSLKVHCRAPLWEGDIEVTPDGRLERFVEGKGGPLKLWVRTEREPLGVFGCGNDIGGGTGATLSVCSIGNCATGEKAARYSTANLSPEVFALVVAALCRWFGNAKAAWEHHGPGVQFGKALMRDAGYRNVFVGKPEDRLKRGASVVTTGPGWRPMGGNKNLLLLDYIRALSNRLFLNYDEEALLDTLEFRYDASGKMVHSQDDGRDPEVARENHGDLTIADALCWKMIDGGGQLVATKKIETPPEEAPEWSVLTWEGRRRLHEARRKKEEDWE